jgi:hypothetical protein
MLEEFEEVSINEKEQWIWKIPDDFVETLNSIDESEIRRASEEWSKAKDSIFDLETALVLIGGMRRVAKRAQLAKQPMYLYLSL